MDLAVTFKAYAQDNISEANHQPKIVPFNPPGKGAATARSQCPSHRPSLFCCQECLHPNGKPVSLLIQHHAPALHFSHSTNEYVLTYGPTMTTCQDVVRIKPDLSCTALLDVFYRHSSVTLPWVESNAIRRSEASYKVAGERWHFLDAQRCEDLMPLIWDKEASVRFRVRAVDYTEEWEKMEMKRLMEGDRRKRETRRGCVVM